MKRKCWCFVTEGMGAANQEEMVKLLLKLYLCLKCGSTVSYLLMVKKVKKILSFVTDCREI